MNILFFLTPKNEVAYVENDDTLRQVLEKIEYHKYTAIPMLNKNGKYVGTVTEGDLLVYQGKTVPEYPGSRRLQHQQGASPLEVPDSGYQL